MLEALLITACLYGTETSCISSGQAYYKYSKLEEKVQIIERNLEKELPLLYRTGSYAFMFYIANKQKTYRLPMGTFYIEQRNPGEQNSTGLIGFNTSF